MEDARTMSTCSPDTAEGTHVFSIAGYSQHRGMGLGKFLRSGAFAVGGHCWSIRFYPDGKDYEDLVTVCLEILSKGVAATVRLSSDLRLVDQATGLSSSVMKTEPKLFNCGTSVEYIRLFAWSKKRTGFEESYLRDDDRVDIEYVVTVMKEPRVSQTKSPAKFEVPPSDIAAHLGELLGAKEAADVTFCVGGETFAAHKVVLAMRSPVFKAELFGLMREKETQLIPIEDMQPDVFKALLHFIYTDSVPIIDDLEGDDRSEMVRHLLVAADRYAMERLKMICQSILFENLGVQNVATTLALADQHHCNRLKDACIEFMSSLTMDDLVETQGFQDLKISCPSVLVDALLNMIKFHKR